MALELGLIVDRAILAAAVGMVDQPGQRTPRQKRSSESSQGQIPMQTITKRPADDTAGGEVDDGRHADSRRQTTTTRPPDDTAGEEVDDDGQIQPSFAGPDIGDVCSPLLVRPLGREVLIDDVRRDRPGMMTVGGAFEPPLLPGAEAILTHQ